jgi:hypothetical protein
MHFAAAPPRPRPDRPAAGCRGAPLHYRSASRQRGPVRGGMAGVAAPTRRCTGAFPR